VIRISAPITSIGWLGTSSIHLRGPFTAKWHVQTTKGALTALDATDEFRADLKALHG
jgi:hypothetical protein